MFALNSLSVLLIMTGCYQIYVQKRVAGVWHSFIKNFLEPLLMLITMGIWCFEYDQSTTNPLQGTIPPFSKNHTTLFKVPHRPPKKPHHPLQSIASPSSKYHTTLFKVPHHLFKVAHTPLQNTASGIMCTDAPIHKYGHNSKATGSNAGAIIWR